MSYEGSRKRDRRQLGLEPGREGPDSKRIELDNIGSATRASYHAICSQYRLELPFQQYIGLCAYLCTILRWGYRIDTTELDGFIQMYTAYENDLKQFEELQATSSSACIPSYHQWYLHQLQENPQTGHILKEEVIRAIWSEHPYTFLQAEHRLIAIAQGVLTEREENRASKLQKGVRRDEEGV